LRKHTQKKSAKATARRKPARCKAPNRTIDKAPQRISFRLIHQRSDGTRFTFEDVLAQNGARRAFEGLVKDGCDSVQLRRRIMMFHTFKATDPRATGLSRTQRAILNRALRLLEKIGSWASFRGFLPVEDSEGPFERDIVRFRAALQNGLQFTGRFRAVNGKAQWAHAIVELVRTQTGRPHFGEVRILLDSELTVAGGHEARDLYTNTEAFSKEINRLTNRRQ